MCRPSSIKGTENAFKGLGPRPAFKEDLRDKGTN